jgi:hypothetical protein
MNVAASTRNQISNHHSEPQMSRKSPDAVAPRLLTLKEAASYWGSSPNTFRKLVREGIAPGPIYTPGMGRKLFDRLAQDQAIDARSTVQSAPVATSDPTWDD